MPPDRWLQVEQLYHSTLELGENERAAYLDSHCGDDPSLRREVESLLAYPPSGSDFMDKPALEMAAQWMAQQAQTGSKSDPLIGGTVGNFKIVERLGAGGMGVVYRALDRELHRPVALKFLPPLLAHDPAALERFRREAQAASALNHPGICVIHAVGEDQGQPFIVMELLEGSTLGQLIKGEALAMEQVLKWGADLADALAAAHARGIIHRDVKPGNIFVTRDGRVKILDFGLAKLQTQPSQATGAGELSTYEELTATGIPLGTFAYMSPEQARGQELDARTDLFSFGATLYEMATGAMAFQGKTLAETHDAILNRQPAPASQVNAAVSAGLQELIQKCMEKDPGLRYQSAAEVHADLLRLRQNGGSSLGKGKRRTKWRAGGRRHARLLALASILLATGTALYFYLRPQKVHALSDNDVIVLADFTNSTGEPMFDNTLREALAVGLEQSPFLKVLSDQRMSQRLREMNRPPGERITPDVGREICLRTASQALLTGSIAAMGSHYALQLKATNCQSGDVLGRVEGEAESREKVLPTLGQAATSLRARLGESLASVQKYDRPLEEVTTSSLEALRAYSDGMKVWSVQGDAAAMPLFRQAVALDPNFASAYIFLAGQGDDPNGEDLRHAFALRNRVTEPEKHFIAAQYYADITGEIPRAIEELQLLVQEYPRHTLARGILAGDYMALGQWPNAEALLREQMRLRTSGFFGHTEVAVRCYACLSGAYLALGRMEEAQSVLNQVLPRNPDSQDIREGLYLVAFAKNDTAARQQQLDWAAGKPRVEGGFLRQESRSQAYFGHLRKARELSRAAEAVLLRDKDLEGASACRLSAAIREVRLGSRQQALQSARAALAISESRVTRIFAAYALIEAGDSLASRKLMDALSREAPLDTIVQNYWLPVLRAQIELSNGHAQRALELLQPAAAYEMGAVSGPMYAAYVRGQAYLSTGDGPAAAPEFQKIVDHRGLVLNDSSGALAHLYLGRARALEARSAQAPGTANRALVQARAAYQDFLTLWKDADPDIPILRQAKAEFSRLQN